MLLSSQGLCLLFHIHPHTPQRHKVPCDSAYTVLTCFFLLRCAPTAGSRACLSRQTPHHSGALCLPLGSMPGLSASPADSLLLCAQAAKFSVLSDSPSAECLIPGPSTYSFSKVSPKSSPRSSPFHSMATLSESGQDC